MLLGLLLVVLVVLVTSGVVQRSFVTLTGDPVVVRFSSVVLSKFPVQLSVVLVENSGCTIL